jgi:hypothetical protein
MKIKSILFNFENILLVFWFGLLLSINSKISDIYSSNINYLQIIIIFLRIITPVLVFLILIFFLKIKKLNLFILSYLIYGLWQLIIYSPNEKYLIDNLERYHLIISMIGILLIIHVAEYYKFKDLIFKILYSSILFITIISFYFTYFLVLELINDERVFYLYFNHTLITEGKHLLQVYPRITGISRMLGLVLLFIFCLFICKKKNISIYNFFFSSALFVISFVIYGMQSKGSYISILVLLFYYIFFFKDQIKKKIFILFIILVAPIICFESIIKMKMVLVKEYNVKSRFLSNNSILINDKLTEDYTTGRIEIWKRAFKKIKEKKIILGYGPQADRFLLESLNFDPNTPRHFYDANASNGIIYSYLCAGIVGLLFISTIYLLICYEIYKSIFKKKAFKKKNSYVIFSILTLSFLTLRTVYENGYTLFGVDFLFTIICYFILRKFNLEKNKKIIL